MSVEIRSLARTLFVEQSRNLIACDDCASKRDAIDRIATACWDAAEMFDREGQKREAAESKSYVPPVVQKAEGK